MILIYVYVKSIRFIKRWNKIGTSISSYLKKIVYKINKVVCVLKKKELPILIYLRRQWVNLFTDTVTHYFLINFSQVWNLRIINNPAKISLQEHTKKNYVANNLSLGNRK